MRRASKDAREIVLLSLKHGYSVPAIANVTGLSERTIYRIQSEADDAKVKIRAEMDGIRALLDGD